MTIVGGHIPAYKRQPAGSMGISFAGGYSAAVTAHHDNGTVDVVILEASHDPHILKGVPLVAPGAEPPNVPWYCEWQDPEPQPEPVAEPAPPLEPEQVIEPEVDPETLA